jgi:hypothetical protein
VRVDAGFEALPTVQMLKGIAISNLNGLAAELHQNLRAFLAVCQALRGTMKEQTALYG